MFVITENIDSLLEYAIKHGSDYADIRYGQISEKRIHSIDGEIYTDLANINSSFGIRMLAEGIVGFVSVPHLRSAKKEVNKALNNAKYVSSWKKGVSKLSEGTVVEASVAKKPKTDWKDIDEEELSEIIDSIYSHIVDNLKVKAKIEKDFLSINWTELFKNSEGSRVYQDFTYTVLTLTGRILNNGTQVKYYQNFGGLGGLEVLPYKNLEEMHQFIEIINNLPYAKTIQPGICSAVLSEDISWTLTHEVFGHSLEGDNVLSGRSFSAGMLGLKIAPSHISVIDDPYIETIGYYEYDSEGMKGKGTLLVDDGILTDFLHSRETASAMGAESSANYRAYSSEFLPQVRMSNTFVEPKDFSTEELLEHVKNGIYIGDGLGGSSEPQTGEYNLDAQYGRKIENGEFTDYLLNFQLSGRMIDTLSTITAVGDRLLAQPGSCVKNNQRIFVGSVSPKMAVSKMRVS